jgi:hypothetical protein
MKEIMDIIKVLCQALQQKSLYILNDVNSVSIAKELIQRVGDDHWNNLLESVVYFCKQFEINILDLSVRYIGGRCCHQGDHITTGHHCHFGIFNTIIAFQLQELDSRVGENAFELLTLGLVRVSKLF